MTDTIEVLEGMDLLHIDADTALDVALAIEEGLPVRVLEAVISRYELSTSEVEQIISRKTLGRRKESGGVLSADESDKLARLARVFRVAEETLESLDNARQWMRRSNRALRGQTPISLLKTDQGARVVEQILGRIAYGVFS